MKRVLDRGVWVVALSAALTLSSVSLLLCPTAHAGNQTATAESLATSAVPAHAPTEASKSALSLQADDDGNELLEHWDDPKDGREEQIQILGIAAGLGLAGVAGALRRRVRRRASLHV